MSSSQLTFVFFRGVGLNHHTDIYIYIIFCCVPVGHGMGTCISYKSCNKQAVNGRKSTIRSWTRHRTPIKTRAVSVSSGVFPGPYLYSSILITLWYWYYTATLCSSLWSVFTGMPEPNDGGGGVLSVWCVPLARQEFKQRSASEFVEVAMLFDRHCGILRGRNIRHGKVEVIGFN